MGASVSLYSDSTTFVNCEMYDDIPGLRTVYVILAGGPADAVRFKIEPSPGMTMTYLSESHYAPVLEGDTQNGITFCFGETLIDPVLLATIQYMAHGTSDCCSEIRSVPYPGSNTIDLIYNGSPSYADGERIMINPQCQCDACWNGRVVYGPPDNPYDFCQPVDADLTTGGRIKAVYR